jgi:U2-associated protein SR140
MRWGRLKAEKWRRSVMAVLSLWEGWCVFPQAAQEAFVEGFNRPPLTEKEKIEEEAARKKAEESKFGAASSKSKWRSVDETEEKGGRVDFSAGQKNVGEEMDIDVDGQPMDDGDDEDLGGVEMEDVDGVPIEDDDDEEDVDGVAMDEDGGDNVKEKGKEEVNADGGASAPLAPFASGGGTGSSSSPGVIRRRQRPRAEDMFADSDEE